MSGAPRRLARVLDPSERLCLARIDGERLQPVRGDLFGELRDAGSPFPLTAAASMSSDSRM
jgi:hypothetical protein